MLGGLRKNSIGFMETSFQGIAGSAPAGAAVATLTGAAAFAGQSLPLAALLGFFVVLLNAVIIRRISLKMAGAGGYYSYIRGGLGVKPAAFSGLFYVFYQVFALALISLSTAVFVPIILSSAFGINLPSYSAYLLVAGTLGFGFAVSYSGIRLSSRFAMVMAAIEIVVIVAFGIIILALHPSINNAQVFTDKYSATGFSGVGLGVLLMYTAFSGFGAATPLGEEARKPKKTIGNSVIFSVFILGAFFIFTSYIISVAGGGFTTGAYSSSFVPGVLLMKNYLGTVSAIVVTVLFVNSLLTGSVIVTNSTSRVMMEMSKDRIIHGGLSKTGSKRKTPYASGIFVVLTAGAVAMIANLLLGGFNAFIFSATAATLGVLLVHGIINASLPGLESKESAGIRISSVAMAVTAIIIFGLIFYSTFLSVSSAVIAGTVVFIVFAIANAIYTLKRQHPQKSIEASYDPERA
ncbi:MAG: APC family permease [Candidatus Thermoplasmatota archaeon]|nr:APC family permease [Candidatus Thermoplasmatota archaeon]